MMHMALFSCNAFLAQCKDDAQHLEDVTREYTNTQASWQS